MFDPTEYIKKAKMVDGGHLSIGRGGYDIENIKALCIEAGLPVIDSYRASGAEIHNMPEVSDEPAS